MAMGSNPDCVVFIFIFSNNLYRENNLSYLVNVSSQLMVFIATAWQVNIPMALI